MSQPTTSLPESPAKNQYLRQPLPLLPRRGFGQTARKDHWWITPLFVFLGLGIFVVYSTWAAFQGKNYFSGPYISPFYSPELFGSSGHAWFGAKPSFIPAWLPWSPALIILWAPGGFRLTCYYYRGAYYKAFWADPASCAVGEPRNTYLGENSLPLILQNIHRYFMYLAVVFLFFLAYDVYGALWFPGPAGKTHFGIGVGTVILAVNLILLSSYTFGCHSLRHLIGGRIDQLSKKPVCAKAYKCVGCFNRKHMLFAWCSLFTVGFSDLYVRMCAMGYWHDLQFVAGHWRIV